MNYPAPHAHTRQPVAPGRPHLPYRVEVTRPDETPRTLAAFKSLWHARAYLARPWRLRATTTATAVTLRVIEYRGALYAPVCHASRTLTQEPQS